MKTFFLSAKIFYKNIFLVFSYILFSFYVIYDIDKAFKGVLTYNQTSFVFLSSTLSESIICAAFFMFFSYLLFSKTKSCNFDECLSVNPKGKIRLFKNQLLLIVCLITVVSICIIIYNLSYPNTNLQNIHYIFHMLASVFIYIFIVSIVGALIGMFTALIFKPLIAYLVMIAFVLLSSPLASNIAFTISDISNYKINISPIFDVFNLYPLNLDYSPIYSFGISMLPYKIEIMLFWAFGIIGVVLIKTARKTNRIVRSIAYLCVMLCLINFMAFALPSSKVDMSYRIDGTLFADQDFYYSHYNGELPDEEFANFTVTNYDLDLKVKKQLYANVKIKVKEQNLSTYKFTLYRKFKIKSILNQDGEKLEYKQDDDHLEVYSKYPISEFIFKYSGYNSRFYSNPQGIFLPGYFAYYPIAGHLNMMTSDFQSYKQNLLPDDTSFDLKIKYNKKIFTNLNTCEDGLYSGKTNGLTILSGYYESKVVNGIEVVYPFFNNEEFNDKQLKIDVKNFISIKNDDIIEKIFVVPGVNQKSDSVVIFSDYLTTEQIISLPEKYIIANIPYQKRLLYTYQEIYINDKQGFKDIVDSEKEIPDGYDKLATVYLAKAESIGDEELYKNTNIYLFNEEDERSVLQFLNELK